MLVFESLDAIQLPASAGQTYVAVGTFDGVHLGHRALLCGLAERAHAAGGLAVAFTFQNHPRSVIDPATCPRLISPWALKRRLLERLPLDVVVAPAFDPALRAMPPERFVEQVLCRLLRARRVHSGENFRFGHDRAGGPDLLAALAPRFGFEYEMLRPVQIAGDRISSSRIREALAAGRVEDAAAMLGRPHQVTARVVAGDALGRKLGFPTANLAPDPEVLLPGDGVYAVHVFLHERADPLPGMMNIGWRPTVGGRDHRVEVHVIDFEGELLGSMLTVQVAGRLRGERRFGSPEELAGQLGRDRHAALEALAGHRVTLF